MKSVRLAALAAALALPTSALAAEDGKAIFLKYKCNMCHTIEAHKIEQVAQKVEGEEPIPPKDLSDIGSTRKADWIKEWVQKKVEVDGKKHKKLFGGTPEELDVVAKWLESQKKKK